MKLLYLVPRTGPHGWDTKMSQVRKQQVIAIGRHDRARVWVSGPGWPDWDAARTPAENAGRLRVSGEDPDLVLSYKVGGLRGCGTPVAVAYNEAFAYDRVNAEVEDAGAELVIFHHWNDAARYAHWAGRVARVHLPHCADASVYRDRGLEKDVDVLVAGNLQHSSYPFRARLARLAVRQFAKRGWRVKVLPHPGYALPPREGTFVGEDFARWLNRSKVVLTCSMRHRYQLAKYSEIALCRALPVGDTPDECRPCLERHGRMALAVEPWETDEDIVRRVEDVLDDPERLRVLTDRACETATRELTMGSYAERFVEAAEAFLGARAAPPRRPLRGPVPAGTTVVYSYPDDATEDERKALTLDHLYTVETVRVARAPVAVRLRELPDLEFPATLFREAG